MKVVITGASGFVGKVLTEKLAADSEVLCLGRSAESLKHFEQDSRVKTHVTDYSVTDLVKATAGYDTLIHLAGRRLTHDDDPIKISPFTDATMEMLDNLLTAAATNDFKRVVNTSSIGVYSMANESPYSEVSAPKPATPYGLTKLFTEQAIDFWSRKTKIPVGHLRLTQCYGYGEKWTPVLMRFIKNAMNGDTLTVNNSGFKIDQVYVEDAVEAFILLAKGTATGSYNIGSGKSLSLLIIAETVKEVINNDVEVDLSADMSTADQPSRHMSILKAKQDLGWVPKYDLVAGLQKMKAQLYNSTP